MLLCMPSSGMTNKNIQKSYLNTSPDRLSLTENYIRGLSRDMLEKSPPTIDGRLKLNLPLTTSTNTNNNYDYDAENDDNHDETPPLRISSSSYANFQTNDLGFTKQDVTSRSSYDFRKSASPRIQSILPDRIKNGPLFPASNKTYVSPPKTVKFEDIIDKENDSYHTKQYVSYQEKPVSLGLDVYGRVLPGLDKDDEFDVDEKVKEGKAILERLLKSTETRKNYDQEKKFSHHSDPVLDNDYDDPSFNHIKSPLSSSWNETEEIIALGGADFTFDVESDSWAKVDRGINKPNVSSQSDSNDKRSQFMKSIKERRDKSYLMSTRLEMNDERPPLMSQSEGSLLDASDKLYRGTNKNGDISDEKLMDEIKVLKEELSNQQVNSFLEMKSIKEDSEKVVGKLYAQISNLTKQKETLEEYITQLKGSLTKKNDKCFELQEHLHKKLTLIHQLTTADDKDRHNLENEVNILQVKKRNLEEQVNKMETSLKIQYEEIRELEKRFQREKQNNLNTLNSKDEEIVSLHHEIDLLTEESKRQCEDLIAEHQVKIENYLMKGKNDVQSEIEEMKLKLDLEVDRHSRLQKKHQSEVNHLKSNFETLRTANVKLKHDLELSRQQNHEQDKCSFINMKNAREEADLENDLLKKKLIEYEKIQKTMALELIEESTKLAVICGTPASTRVSSPDTYVDCNIMSEALIVFKEHLENFRHYALSLRNESSQKPESYEEGSTSNGPTSAKLLRHLQNRVQQLRKENEMLHASLICENCHNEIKSNASDDVSDERNIIEEHSQVSYAENDVKKPNLESSSPINIEVVIS